MQTASLVQLLCELYCPDIQAYKGDLEAVFKSKFESILGKVSFTYDDVCQKLKIMNAFDCDRKTYEWKYLCLNFYLLELLKQQLELSEHYLSVKDSHLIKGCLKNLVSIGIRKNLQRTLPYYEPFHFNFLYADIQYSYDILKITTNVFYLLSRSPELKVLFLAECLNSILIAMYQIAFCPLKRPDENEIVLNVDQEQLYYFKLLQEQEQFKINLIEFEKSLHPIVCTRATMQLFTQKIPRWLRRQLAKKLTAVMHSHGGIKRISFIMLEGFDNDTTKTWPINDVLTRLVLSLRHSKDFSTFILPQLLTILDFTQFRPETWTLERFVVQVAQKVAISAPHLFLKVIIPRLLKGWTRFTTNNTEKISNCEDVTLEVSQAVRLLCTFDRSNFYPVIAHAKIKEIIKIVFNFFLITNNQKELATVHEEIKKFLGMFISQFSYYPLTQYFDCLIFNNPMKGVLEFKSNTKIGIGAQERIILEPVLQTVTFSVITSLDTMLEIFNNKLKAQLFMFLMNSVLDSEKNFNMNLALLESEESLMASSIERFVAVHTSLTKLSKDAAVIKVVKSNPNYLIQLIEEFLRKAIQKETHKNMSGEGNDLFFVVLMIVDTLVKDSSEETCLKYFTLRETVLRISLETENREVRKLCDQIVNSLATRKQTLYEKKRASEYDLAIEECYDVNLPIRAKGLLALSKLIERKDPETMAKSQFLLTLFQVFLQDGDSYIYLNTVKAFAALGTEFSFTVLNVLCDQFLSYVPKEDGVDPQEVRMKLGEVLVKIIRKLGEMAPQFKAMLLNTFLAGTKDDDHLIRSSSLSNLGEVCEVLGYKLGSITSEILACVNGVLATDPAPEPRRAAVFVLTQLMKGLSTNTLICLENELHSIYVTLKLLYKQDRDDIVRLQAQLALEFLNDNILQTLTSNIRLHYTKSPISM